MSGSLRAASVGRPVERLRPRDARRAAGGAPRRGAPARGGRGPPRGGRAGPRTGTARRPAASSPPVRHARGASAALPRDRPPPPRAAPTSGPAGCRALRLGRLGQAEVVGGVPSTHRVRLAPQPELLAGELPDRLQHPEARLAVRGDVVAQQALAASDSSPSSTGDPAGGAHRVGRLDVEAAVEDRQAGEQPPLALAQEIVAPGDRPAQRPVPHRQVSRPLHQEDQALLQPGQQRLLDRKTRVRAAASSIARGRPSSRWQISATAAAFVASSAKPGRAAVARSTNSCTASYCRRRSSDGRSPRVGHGQRRHRELALGVQGGKGWRPVASTFRPRGGEQKVRPTGEPAASTCSTLSSTSSTSRSRSSAANASKRRLTGPFTDAERLGQCLVHHQQRVAQTPPAVTK